jgi:hypothetical protein
MIIIRNSSKLLFNITKIEKVIKSKDPKKKNIKREQEKDS